jgi:hypothetical protein
MRHHFASILLRFGLAFVFLFAAVSGFLAPQNWIGYLPNFATAILPPNVLLVILGLYEIILAIFLLFKKEVALPALLAALTLFGITIVNLPQFDVVFRDVGLAFAALALFFIGKIRA